MKIDQNPKNKSSLIKTKALKLGFLDCGFSKAEKLEGEEKHLKEWLEQRMHGEMHYMENHFEKRLNPKLLHQGTKSIISLIYNYKTDKQPETDNYKISKYAYGKDYHHIIKSKLKQLVQHIESIFPEANCRAFVDSAPVMDRVWAKKAGLGWIGKNTNLISRQHGSFFFIAEILLNIELDYTNQELKDYCGTCTQCIDACPTQAIYKPYHVNGSKCISYLTIELKDEIPDQFKGKYKDWIFGCDICQDVCPWNKKPKNHTETDFEPHPNLLKMKKTDWEDLNNETYRHIFNNSAVKRTKFEGLKRNITFLSDQ